MNSSDISNGPSIKSKRCLMVFPAARKILVIKIEIEWSNDHKSVATPCQTALGTYELRLGAEDGANKAGIDHLVKTMTYSCGDELLNVCSDTDLTEKRLHKTSGKGV